MAAISEELDRLSCEGIGYCLDLIAAGEDLWPTLFSGSAQDMKVQSFEDDSPDAGLEAAWAEARKLDGDLFAIGYDGFFQTEDEEIAQQAVILVFGERGTESAYTACVPYWMDGGELYSSEPIPGGEEPLPF